MASFRLRYDEDADSRLRVFPFEDGRQAEASYADDLPVTLRHKYRWTSITVSEPMRSSGVTPIGGTIAGYADDQHRGSQSGSDTR